jgi:acetyltransferase
LCYSSGVMSVANLDRIFRPRRIALVGVTPNPQSVGGKLLSNLVGAGFNGVVYPVNPTSEAVLGIPCFPDIHKLPNVPDLAIICTAAEKVPAEVRAAGEAGVRGIIIISAGFREAGPAGQALEEQVRAEARRFEGMRILGPNCLGVLVPSIGLNASFATGLPKAGHIAFISQSGALCSSVLDWALDGKIGFSYFCSVGNALDVDFGDLIDYFGADDQTHSIVLYIESISDARKFMTAARAFARRKPIIAYKAGRFPQSAQVAASHTGAMAAQDGVFQAAFDRTGIVRVTDIGEIFDCVELVGRRKMPRGPRLGIVTNAGGPGVMATDALLAEDGELAKLAPETVAALDEVLPPMWSHGNPVDVLGDAPPKRVAKAVELVTKDKGVDAVLVILTPQGMTNPTLTAKAVGDLAAGTTKPLLAAWIGGHTMREGARLLTDAGVAAYNTPEQAVRAFMTLTHYARNLEALYETPKDVPVEFTVDRERMRVRFGELLAGEGSTLSETASKALLEAYGIRTTAPRPARSADEAVAVAAAVGYPVVLKIASPDISHKTDVGGVVLDLHDEVTVRAAYARILGAAAQKRPDARLEGVTVQRMVRAKDGVEMILGAKKDPVFGTVILAGLGGIAAEIYADRALGFPPLNESLARRMLESLKVWPLLEGYRGRPPANVALLVEALIRLSYLCADYPEIVELDINPLLCTASDAVALDARIVLDRAAPISPRPYAHLSLRPYPEEHVRKVELADTPILFRPIKPEDEPLWMDMLGACSRETIYARFHYFFQWSMHENATRYCFIDYDREIAIVAEVMEEGVRKLLGVGRLVADPDHESVEYAVLVRDDWQNRGLGSLLTDYCLDIASTWGMKRIIAQTTTDNPRMIAVFEKRGFAITPDPDGSVVNVEKVIA